MAAAAPGRLIGGPERGPPWIIADHSLAGVLVTPWPGRLWLVEVTDPATVADMEPAGGPPLASAGYTRAVTVAVIEEVPTARLFGDRGEQVMEVIGRAEKLDAAQAARLAAARPAGADQAYARAWQRWIAGERPGQAIEGYDLASTLEYCGSPINKGFLVISDVVRRRAEQLAGEAAFASDEGETWLLPPWSEASAALCEAAMALGAPQYVTDADRGLLTRSYGATFGGPRAESRVSSPADPLNESEG